MSKQYPGTHPARKGKQKGHSHCVSDKADPRRPFKVKPGTSAAAAADEISEDEDIVVNGGDVAAKRAEKEADRAQRKLEARQEKDADRAYDLGVKREFNLTAADLRAASKKVNGLAPTYSTKIGASGDVSVEFSHDQTPLSNVYAAAVKVGFRTKEALDRFNADPAWAHEVNKAVIPVCAECGNHNVALCDHFIVPDAPKAGFYEDAALVIPKGENFNYRLQIADRIKRMFTWPKFFPESHVNRELNGYRNRQILDDGELLIGELLAYIRFNMHTSYAIAGVEDRNLRLAHCKKLADRFISEKGWDKTMTPLFVNSVLHTVQVAADNGENKMLLSENAPSYNLHFHNTLPRPILVVAPLALLMLHPTSRAKLYTAVVNPLLSILRKHTQALSELLLTGSALTLRQSLILARNMMRFIASNTSRHSTFQWLKLSLQSLWRTAAITCTTAFTSATSRLCQNTGVMSLMWHLSKRSSPTW